MCAWLCVRARCAKIVVDTEKWKLFWLRNFFLIAAKEWVKNRQQRFVMINLRRVAPHYHTACIPLCRFVCEIRRCIHRFGIESETQRFSFLWRRFKLCTCVCVGSFSNITILGWALFWILNLVQAIFSWHFL